jgi:2-desacetyl-2-hydroxyethyl bacteriochlorophyllide A dehydrogenase
MVLREYNQPLRLEDVEIPTIGVGELLVRVKACGVCASNLKYVREPADCIKLPHILGHEPAGEVMEVGPDVHGFAQGDRVCIYIFVTCRACVYCTTGQENSCLQQQRLGHELPGAYAEYLRVPAWNTFKIPEGISFEEAGGIADAMVTSYHAVREKAQVSVGEDVAVMGVGGLGSNAVQLARLAGCRVIAIDITPGKLEFARTLGADDTINAQTEEVPERIRTMTKGKGVEVFFDYVGTRDSMQAGLRSLRRGGKFVLVGHEPGHDFQAKTFQELIMEEVQLIGSHASTRNEMQAVLKLIQDGKIRPLIGAVYPLAEANEAHHALEHEDVLGRIVLLP